MHAPKKDQITEIPNANENGGSFPLEENANISFNEKAMEVIESSMVRRQEKRQREENEEKKTKLVNGKKAKLQDKQPNNEDQMVVAEKQHEQDQ